MQNCNHGRTQDLETTRPNFFYFLIFIFDVQMTQYQSRIKKLSNVGAILILEGLEPHVIWKVQLKAHKT